jgi:polyhydroxybutyrate depolymerase
MLLLPWKSQNKSLMKNSFTLTFCISLFLTCNFLLVDISQAQCDYIEVNAVSTTGNWGNEMAWELYGPEPNSMNLIANFQGESDWSNSSELLCLEPGCYAVVMTDSWGDGWNGGGLTLEFPETDISVSFNDGYIGYETFELAPLTDDCVWELPGCTNPAAENYTIGATIDDGTCFFTDMFITSEDIERSYHLYTPDELEDGAPLIFVLHGYGGTNLDMMAFCGMNEIADAEGFAVCYPQGLQDFAGSYHWNANLTGMSDVDDVLYLTELAEFLQVEHGLNSDCTYSCGYSNGGYMSYTLACEGPDVFRGIGSVGGTMSGYDFENCTPNLVPVVNINGTSDNIVSYYATDEFDDYPWSGAAGVEDVVESWAIANNCTQTMTTPLPDIDPTDGSTVDLIKHTDGDFGYQAWVYRVNGGGHDWFGAWGNMDIHSSAVIWSFLSTFCGTTISTDDLIPDNGQLFTYTYSSASNQIELHGLENSTCQIFDNSGKLVAYLPLFSGQTKFTSLQSSGLYTIISRSTDLSESSIQREKVVLR